MSKYHNVKTERDGYKFDSRAEARRYGELELLQRAGKIHNLVVHRRFALTVNGFNVGVYIADFDYYDNLTPALIVEDVKGVRTAVYKLKKKLMFAIHAIHITEIEA